MESGGPSEVDLKGGWGGALTLNVLAQWPVPHAVDPGLGSWDTQNPWGGVNHSLYSAGLQTARCFAHYTCLAQLHGPVSGFKFGAQSLPLIAVGRYTDTSVCLRYQFSLNYLGVGRVKLSPLGVISSNSTQDRAVVLDNP